MKGCMEKRRIENTTQESKVKVTVTLALDQKRYETFIRTFDQTSFQEIASSVMNDTLENLTNPNACPEAAAWWIERQNKRLMKKED